MSNVKAKCTKFHFRWVSTRDPAAGAHVFRKKKTPTHIFFHISMSDVWI